MDEDEIRELQKARKRLTREYRRLFNELAAILARHDPIGIIYGDQNPNEYEAEVGTIMPRLRGANSLDDCRCIIHEEFTRWFSPGIAGPQSKYAQIAEEFWGAWQSMPRNS